MERFVIFLLLLVTGNALASSYGTNFTKPTILSNLKITNGQEAKPHSIPFQVYLLVTDFDQRTRACGGSLISQHYVLTAAHCCTNAESGMVLLGAHDISLDEPTQQFISISAFKYHEDFHADPDKVINDICVLKLKKPATLNNYVKTVKLPNAAEAEEDLVGETCRVSGWGLIKGGTRTTSNVLLYIDSTIISRAQCSENFTVDDTQLCMSNDEGKSSCQGDSGGPLTHKGTQVGIVSYGDDYCTKGIPAVYTNVGKYVDWIQTNTDVELG